MRYIVFYSLILLSSVSGFGQNSNSGKFSYGKRFFVAFDYGFADFEGAEFTEDYYKNLSNSTLVTKYLNSILGDSEVKFFGYKSLDTKDNIVNINSYQLKVGTIFNLFNRRIQLGLYGNIGLFKLSRIATDFTVSGIDIKNPKLDIEDVTIFGTFSHRFIDYSYGFGAEFIYEILKNRLKLSLSTNASLSSVRWFTIGLGSKVII